MIGFLLAAIAMVAAATLYLFWPKVGKPHPAHAVSDAERDRSNLEIMRDQMKELENDYMAGVIGKTEYDEAQGELNRRTLEETGHLAHEGNNKKQAMAASAMSDVSPKSIWGLASFLVLLLVAGALYWVIGSPDAFLPKAQVVAQQEADDAHSFTAEQFDAMLQKFAARMAQEPDNIEGWLMLARSYAETGKYQQAVDAYEKVIDKVSDDPNIFADYADLLAYLQGGKLGERSMEMVERALKIDPTHWKALGLAGTHAFDSGNYKDAESYWLKMKGALPAGSEMSRMIDASIEEARQRQIAGDKKVSVIAQDTPSKQGSHARLEGTVSLAHELQEKVSPEDRLVVYARRVEGAATPIAFITKTVADLPLSFVLDESTTMIKSETLASAKNVIVVARVSKSGQANAQPGDLEGISVPVDVNAIGVRITIDREIQ